MATQILDGNRHPLPGGAFFTPLTAVSIAQGAGVQAIVPFRRERSALLICNTSTTGTIALAFSSSTGLTTSAYVILLQPGQTLIADAAYAMAGVYCASPATAVTLAWQESITQI